MEIPESSSNDEATLAPTDPPLLLFFFALILGILLGALIGGLAVAGLGYAQGIDLQTLVTGLDKHSSFEERNFIRIANLLSHVLTFTVPAILVSIFFYRRWWWASLQLSSSPKMTNAGLSILFMLFSFPLAQLTYYLNRQLPLPEWTTRMEESTNTMIEGMLVMDGPGELLLNLLLVGVIPAIGEELIFRGLIQQQLQKRLMPPGLAVWVTALIFSAFHFQFEGFIPRFLLGALLGYLFLWTRNLWIPIIAHFFFNGVQVAGQYFYAEQLEDLDMESMPDSGWSYGIISLLAVIGIGYVTKKINEPNNT